MRRREFHSIVLRAPLTFAAIRQLPAQETGAFRLSVSMELVVLYATVRDHQGRLVSGLTRSDFQVYEEGVPQAVRLFSQEDVPVTVGLVVDHSGSMHTRMPAVLNAASAFARSSNSRDQMFVVNFNEHARLGLLESVPFTSDPSVLQEALERAPVAGQTALYDAIAMGTRQVRAGRPEKKVLVVISDGGDNASRMTSLMDIENELARSGVIVYTIGLFDEKNRDANPAVLKRLAHLSGGEVYLPEELKDVSGICEEIARGIRAQYVLGYVSSNTERAGVWRNLRATAHLGRKDLTVRTRAGYSRARQSEESR